MKRFNVLCCGRRWGKTVLGIDVAAEVALAGYPVGWFAPTYKILDAAWRDLLKVLRPYVVRSNATDHRLELVTGGVVEMWSLDSKDSGRSRKYARVIVDEAAMVPGLMAVWNEAIRPTLADMRGDAWFLSTPKGRNDFWQLYQRGQDTLQPEWVSWQMPTTSNPFISLSEIEAAKQDSPERVFAQEYLAEFLEDSAVFRKIKEAATAKKQEYAQHGHPSHPKHRYVMGVDLARYNDFTVIVVVDVTTREQCYMDRFNQMSWPFQMEKIRQVAEMFQVEEIAVDQTGVGDPIVELLQRDLPGAIRRA